MPKKGGGERWVNKEETRYVNLYRVRVPLYGPHLVRATSERQAREIAVESLGYAAVDEISEKCRVEALAYPKVTVQEGTHPTTKNPQVEVILETAWGCISVGLEAEGSFEVHVGPADYAAYDVLKGNVEDGKRVAYAVDYGDEKEHLILDDAMLSGRRR